MAGAIATYATSWHERLAETYYRESQEREDLRVALAQAQLRSLRLQLNPHFLFNTMNGIVALIPSDPRSAERMLTGLSDFLRLSLHNAGEQEVPIEREIQLLERYVMIQQLRFQDRLRISISVDPAREPRARAESAAAAARGERDPPRAQPARVRREARDSRAPGRRHGEAGGDRRRRRLRAQLHPTRCRRALA